MKILITAFNLNKFCGTFTFIDTIAKFLVEKHDVYVKGINEAETQINILRDKGVKLAGDKKNFDIIIANQNALDISDYKGYKIQVIHGKAPQEKRMEGMDNYVVVSQELYKEGDTLMNQPVDVERFKYTDIPYSNKVLIASQGQTAIKNVEEWCKRRKLNPVIMNKWRNPRYDIENVIKEVDVVVGVGRIIPEALAMGRPVIIYDERGYYKGFGGHPKNKPELVDSMACNYTGRNSQKKFTIQAMDEAYSSIDFSAIKNYVIYARMFHSAMVQIVYLLGFKY